MKTIKKADVIIVSVLLMMIAGILFMVAQENINNTDKINSGDSVPAGAAPSRSVELSYTEYNGKKSVSLQARIWKPKASGTSPTANISTMTDIPI